MPLYLLGISRAPDVATVAERVTVGQIPVRWVLVDRLAAALVDASQGPPEPLQYVAALDAIHRRMCVLPMRFGTVLRDEAEIHPLMEGAQRHLLQRLDRLDGTCEMGLRVALPECPAQHAKPSPGAPPSVAYLHQRRAHYQRRDSRGEQARLTVECLVRQLEGAHCDWRWLTPSPPGLVRLAFLVLRERVGLFRTRLEASGRERPEQRRTLLGPWPPYSFVSLLPERRHMDIRRSQPVEPM